MVMISHSAVGVNDEVKKRGSVKHLASGLRVYDENHDAEIDCLKTDVMLVRNRLIAVDSWAWMCDNICNQRI